MCKDKKYILIKKAILQKIYVAEFTAEIKEGNRFSSIWKEIFPFI
jgi:hypothetical protein